MGWNEAVEKALISKEVTTAVGISSTFHYRRGQYIIQWIDRLKGVDFLL
jgi:hypothetical protein